MLESTSLPRFIMHGTSNLNWQKQLYYCVTILFPRRPYLIFTLDQLRCWFHSHFYWDSDMHNGHHDCKHQPQTSQPRMEVFGLPWFYSGAATAYSAFRGYDPGLDSVLLYRSV